jgi:L-ectoine synthase
MKVLIMEDLIGTSREVVGEGFVSYRYVLARDGMGFSLHKTVIPKGEPLHWHYTNHLEACFRLDPASKVRQQRLVAC